MTFKLVIHEYIRKLIGCLKEVFLRLVFLKWQYEEILNDKPDNIVELVRQSRNGHWFSTILRNRKYNFREYDLFHYVYAKLFCILTSFAAVVVFTKMLIKSVMPTKIDKK